MIETLKIINRMQSNNVIAKYAIGGAVGATVYLEPVSTIDIDIFVSFEAKPGQLIVSPAPIYDYLVTDLGYKAENEYILIEGWPVQFLPADDALHREALDRAVPLVLEGVQTWVMTAEHLMALALKVGRKKDELRVENFLESGSYDETILLEILSRHNLIDKWRRIRNKRPGGNE